MNEEIIPICRACGRALRVRCCGGHFSCCPASAIEARRAETQGGSVEDESAVPNGETPKGHRHD